MRLDINAVAAEVPPAESRPTWREPYQLAPLVGSASVAITVVFLAYSLWSSVLSILICYAVWLPRAFGGPGARPLRLSPAFALILLFPLFAGLSVAWSGHPSLSLKASVELLSMIVCTTIAARRVAIEDFIRGTAIGATLVSLIALASGDYSAAEMGPPGLVGLLGSKNMVGLFASIGLFCSALVMWALRPGCLLRATGGGAVLLCLVVLYLSKSASSVVALGAAIGTASLIGLLARVPVRTRGRLLAVVAILVAIGAGLAVRLDAQDLALKALGKDSTLTGRTYLWSQAIKVGEDSPLLGQGYNAFWVQGNLKAEKYWFEFNIRGRSGFHFHNLYLQSYVDLGLVGILILVAIELYTLVGLARRIITAADHPATLFFAGILVLFLVRSLVEVDLLGPFGVPIFLFYGLPIWLNDRGHRPAGTETA